MPTYDFENEQTGEIFSIFMSISAREEFLAENPHIKSIHLEAPGLVTGVNYNRKQDEGWKENLARIAEANPHSALADRFKRKSSFEVKRDAIATKHGFRQNKQNLPFNEEKYFYKHHGVDRKRK